MAWNPPPQAVVTLEVTIIVSTEAREVTKVETGLHKEARGMTVVAVVAWGVAAMIAVAVVGMNSLAAETEVVEEAVTTTTTEVVEEEDATIEEEEDETTTGVVIEEDAGTTVVTVAEECMFLQAHTKHLRSLPLLGEAVSQLTSLMLQ